MDLVLWVGEVLNGEKVFFGIGNLFVLFLGRFLFFFKYGVVLVIYALVLSLNLVLNYVFYFIIFEI